MKKEPTQWSVYQQAVFENVRSGTGNTMVIARAGSGKSAVLVEAVKYIPKRQKTLFVAFGREVAKELDERINKSYIDTTTLHSFGCRAIMAAFGKISIDPTKTLNIVKGLLQENKIKPGGNERFNLIASFIKTISICKAGVIDAPSRIDAVLDEYDIDTFELDRDGFIHIVCQSLRRCKEDKSKIDYGDMVWWPTIFNIPTKTYDRVFIDEANDLSFAQVNLALGACKKGGRVLAVADDRQVLFNWAGVDINAVSILTKRLDAKVLPLPISYRCPKSVIKLAQEIVPDIQAAPNAKEGSVENISEDIFLSFVKPGDFILSRVNAPLIYYCMELIRNKVPANILGRDVATGLLFLVKRSEAKSVDEFLTWLDKWKQGEIARLKDKNRDPILILDKAMCLEHLCRGAKSLDQVKSNIKEMFTDDSEDKKSIVWLSSIHRSKGLEADRVFLLMNTLRKDGTQSELNVEYVAKTRSRDTLFLVR
jgi:DNA helicase-2/ATP-dependent DNA helicase PcrA